MTSNGLDPKYFEDGNNFQNVFVYGSAPNRGLYQVLQAWPSILKQIPNAKLQIFYGFTPAFLNWAQQKMPHFEQWKQEIEHMVHENQQSIHYFGLVDHQTLAKAYANAGFYIYPTSFSETSCVSLMKAMANGAVPITSRFRASALSETCDEFDLGPKEPLENGKQLEEKHGKWMQKWIASVVEAVRNQEKTQALRVKMKHFARSKYRWSNVASQWHEFFQEQLAH